MEKKNFTVQLEPELVVEIDKLAEKLGISRGQLMRNCIISGFDDALMLDKLGISQAINYRHRLKEFKDKIFKGKISIHEEDDKK